jgi:hypothetical protein
MRLSSVFIGLTVLRMQPGRRKERESPRRSLPDLTPCGRPKVDTVCSTIAATSASSATLQPTGIALCPEETSFSTAERTAFSWTSASATATPGSAKALAAQTGQNAVIRRQVPRSSPSVHGCDGPKIIHTMNTLSETETILHIEDGEGLE